ncbi:DNA cytosine methyltransferase [Myroides guanonis]|uniref:Cytosine-specific methyltransferase n=1 Tax=Myroides guanonis TaxID=1150112 RepID=A0A1I3PL56_9FLAO|nr:DNA cytosine methyltransferase [Myroides guanonis]SFJ22235.1 DNA (cytosine-5)-methyltransferase 1 [Myroides guanonis]
MIFKNIDTVVIDKKEKASFLEKVQLHIRITQSIAEINNIDSSLVDKEVSNKTIKKMVELGVINGPDQIEFFKKTLGKLYIEFIQSVNFSISFRSLVGNHLDKLNNTIRAKYQQIEETSSKPTIVDFFCGAGGLSYGFVKEGYKVILANDYEDVCIDTYTYNHPEVPSSKIIKGDIRQIVEHVDDYVNQSVDLVVGGPPCQGFSSANQQRIIDDPRNELYRYFLQAVGRLAPKFVVMENVRGMLPYADQVIEDYHNIRVSLDNRELSYTVGCRILVSDDFGVAQKRQRLIFIAIREDIQEMHTITPELLFDNISASSEGVKRHTLQDALDYIQELDANRIKNTNEIDCEESGKKVAVNAFKGNDSSYMKLINSDRIIPILYNHKARFVNDINYDIYRLLDQGDDATNEKITHLMPYSHRNDVFKDKYFKLVANRPSRTITAHMRMDCHSHIHPYQVRSLTPREAARVQSFPDDYVFLGAYLKTYMQIGNAVPPVMASYIAKEIKQYL